MVIFDASVLIAHLDRDDFHHAQATVVLKQWAREDFGASTITIAESLVGPTKAGKAASAVAALRQIKLLELLLPEGSARQLAQLRAETGLKMPDCCVLLAAEEHRGRVASFDGGLLAQAEARGIGTI